MDLKNFSSAVAQIAEEKGIPYKRVMESVEAAIAAAYKKEFGRKGQIIKAKIDPQTGKVKFWQVKLVVSPEMLYTEEELEELRKKRELGQEIPKEEETEEKKKIRFNPEKYILLEEAKKIQPDIQVGEELEIALEDNEEYGRIAAQTAKQVILQKIKEAEKETIYNEYKEKEGEIISGIIQRIEGKNIIVDVGKTIGILPKEEQVREEYYKIGERYKFYLLMVQKESKSPSLILSRAYPKFLSKLFEIEVPEISQGQVVIRSIAREAGSRSKIAVEAKDKDIDAIGSVVGQRGTRVMTVINELRGEKIDIIEYSDDPQKYIANALSPAKVLEIKIENNNKAVCLVAEDQLSLAIGKDGQNVRLAAKLTGWKIDIKVLNKNKDKEKDRKEDRKEENLEEKIEDKEKKEKEEKTNQEE